MAPSTESIIYATTLQTQFQYSRLFHLELIFNCDLLTSIFGESWKQRFMFICKYIFVTAGRQQAVSAEISNSAGNH